MEGFHAVFAASANRLTDSTQGESVSPSTSVHFHPKVLQTRSDILSKSSTVSCVKVCGSIRGNRQGLLGVSQELRGMSSFGLSEVLVTCQINISPLGSQLHTHTHIHTRLQYPGSDGIGSFPGKRQDVIRVCVSVAERSSLMAGR